MTIDERIKLAFELGQREIDQRMKESGLERDIVIRIIRHEHQAGRRFSSR